MDKEVKWLAAVGIIVLSLSQDVYSQAIKRTIKHIPDTGQTKSYTNTWGEDNDYTIHPPACLLFSPGIVLDTTTGLMWQQTDGGEGTFERAVAYADTLQLGGFDDWRLPTPLEAYSILNHQASNPAMDGAYFTKTAAEYWWTDETQAGDPARVWVTNAGGGVGNHLKAETLSAGGTKKMHVRCVRNTWSTPVNMRFEENDPGIVTDNMTDLHWRKVLASTSVTWEEALGMAESAEYGGFTDWRLPNIKELQSITDLSRTNPGINVTAFPDMGVRKIWASTSLPNQTVQAWYLDTRYGITTHDLKTNKYDVLLVRSEPLSTSGLAESQIVRSIRLFPNPADRSISIESAEKINLIRLYDSAGCLVNETTGNAQDVSSLTPGMYVACCILINGDVRCLPFLVQH